MIISIEFFDAEPIENVVTYLNYEVDKAIFFGYDEVMRPQKKSTARFLTEVCGVKEVEFHAVDCRNLRAIVEAITEVVQREKAAGHKVCFDLTGGESLPLVAFGILAKTFTASMYRFDIETNEIMEYAGDGKALSDLARKRPITMNLDQYISLYSGAINYKHKKLFKEVTAERAEDIERIWNLSRKYGDKWVHYSAILRKFAPDGDLEVQVDEKSLQGEFRRHRRAGKLKDFHVFLSECHKAGVFHVYSAGHHGYHYRYKNQEIKELFWDSGSILEMYTYLLESRKPDTDDCRVGVHIDWDGAIHSGGNRDVLNEIDVMSLRGNIPTFISCKIGNVDQMSLYELETIAKRFGGKHARKVLATAQPLSAAHRRRAEEMCIEVRVVR